MNLTANFWNVLCTVYLHMPTSTGICYLHNAATGCENDNVGQRRFSCPVPCIRPEIQPFLTATPLSFKYKKDFIISWTD